MPSPRYFIIHFMPFTGYPYKGAPSACNLCGSTESVVVAESDRRLKVLRSIACEQCGLIRTDPMPTVPELADYYATDERDAIRIGRRIVARLNWRKRGPGPVAASIEPRHPESDLLGIVPGDLRIPFDPRDVITRIVEGHPQRRLNDLLPWAYVPQPLKAVA